MNRSSALKFIFLLGLVSLCGDVVYEGARSSIGPFLALLGASAAVVGIATGIGEFLGYSLRLGTGYIADRYKSYWLLTFLGYGLIAAIPFLALTGNWKIAVLLIILERMGKGIRSPARDTLLSHATKEMGSGFTFGLHEALDQIGAFLGPLLMAGAFYLFHSYRLGFASLGVFVFFTLFFLSLAKRHYPMASEQIKKKREKDKEKLPSAFWAYLFFSLFSVLGFVNFQLLSYHFQAQTVVPAGQIPLFYALAMGVDAIIALLTGKLYDHIGLKCLLLLPLMTIGLGIFAFLKDYDLAFGAVIIWGCIMGMQETIMRAAVADLTPLSRRGTAYGLFNTAYGLAFFIGSSTIGFLYSLSHTAIITFVVLAEAMAMFFLWRLLKTH